MDRNKNSYSKIETLNIITGKGKHWVFIVNELFSNLVIFIKF